MIQTVTINCYTATSIRDLKDTWVAYRSKLSRQKASDLHCVITSPNNDLTIEYPAGAWCLSEYIQR